MIPRYAMKNNQYPLPPKRLALYGLLSAACIVLDQISKTQILNTLFYGYRLPVINGFFDLTLVYNTGAAFSFLADAGGWQKYFFTVLAFAVSFYLMHEIRRNTLGTAGKWGAALITGGALGNAIDRLLHGHVIDFLLFYWQNHYYPAFNLADSFICIGACCLIADSILENRRAKRRQQTVSDRNTHE